ncbi:hypothetical protein GA0115256_10421, partial [Streptomyces sp. DconLS]
MPGAEWAAPGGACAVGAARSLSAGAGG